MQEREPATRHLRADELREQLELLGEERKTTIYRKRAASAQEPSITGPTERTVTMFDARIEALAGQPSLGIGTAKEPSAAASQHAGRADENGPVRRSRGLSETYRLPRLGKKGPLIGGAAALLSLAMLAAAIAWSASPRVSAERVLESAAPPAPSTPSAALAAVPGPPPAPSTLAQQDRPARPAPAPPAPLAAKATLPDELAPPSGTPSKALNAPRPAASARRAVELLLAGRNRDALDAYRALIAEPGSPAELAVLASLLEHELALCGSDKESERCAR